jgi:hypothetical protein
LKLDLCGSGRPKVCDWKYEGASARVASAAELILDASRMMDDAGDELGRQALEDLSVHVVREFQQIRERLGVLSGEMT